MRRRCRRGWMRRRGPPLPPSAGPSVPEGVLYIPVKPSESLDVKDCVEIYDYEVRALAYVHIEGLTMEEAAGRMGVSKATFWRILEGARFKIAKALSEGKPLKLVSLKQGAPSGEGLLTRKQVSSTGESGVLVG
ncbi:MAG: DUF134 domain-containing protein [Desulfurococcaceae archaeon]